MRERSGVFLTLATACLLTWGVNECRAGLVGVGSPQVTLSNNASLLTSSTNLVSVNVGPLTDTIVPVVSVSPTGGAVYYGTGTTAPTLETALLGLDISNGGNNNINHTLMFASPVTGLNGSLEPDVIIFDIQSPPSGGDSWTIYPIVDLLGTPTELTANAFTFNQGTVSASSDTGQDLRFNYGGGTLTQSLVGFGFDFSDLGLTPGVDELTGVRVVTAMGDPAVVAGLNNSGPATNPFSSISDIDVDNPSPPRVGTTSTLLDLDIGSGSSVIELIPVDTITGSTSGSYWGRDFGPGGAITVSEALTDLDLTTGKANSVDNILWFSKPIPNANGSLPDLAIFEIATGSQGDSWTVQPIIGGTPGAPIYGPSYTLANQSSRFTDTGLQVNVTRNGSESLLQNIYGAGVDLSGFWDGEILGVRVISPGGDPSLFVGLVTVPEPSTALSLFSSLSLCFLRRRRRSLDSRSRA